MNIEEKLTISYITNDLCADYDNIIKSWGNEFSYSKSRDLAQWRLQALPAIRDSSKEQIQYALDYTKKNYPVVYLELLTMYDELKNTVTTPISKWQKICNIFGDNKKESINEKICANSPVPVWRDSYANGHPGPSDSDGPAVC